MQRAFENRSAVSITAVMPSDLAQVRRLRDARRLIVRLLADPTWATHHAYGFHRGGFRDIWLSLATWRAYARLMTHGQWPRRPEQDTYPLGGDVLIDSRGLVAWIYRSRHPADRPSLDAIVSHIDALTLKP